MWTSRKFMQRVGIEHPIVQGPFGGGLSSVRLAADVSNAGGLGSYGAVGLTPEQITAVTAQIRAQTDKPFAINLWVSDHDPGGLTMTRDAFLAARAVYLPYYRELGVMPPEMPNRFAQSFDEQIEALISARPPVFSFVYGVPPAGIMERCRRAGIVTIGTATTVAEAKALEDGGVDCIVATGADAGGHRVSFLASAEASVTGTFALIPQVADAVKIPVVAAGGIADGRGIVAAFALGASAVQIGTAFLACDESGASAVHRAALLTGPPGPTGLTRVYTGRLARGIRNRMMDELTAREAELPPFPIRSWFAGSLKAAAYQQGRSDLISLWAGQAAGLARPGSAVALMESLVTDYRRLLAGA